MSDVTRDLAEAGRLAGIGRLGTALEHYDRALAADPARLEAHFNRAVVLRHLGQLDAAVLGLQAALKLRPEWPAALLGLGDIEFARHRYAEAEAWFNRAVVALPQSAEAQCNLGVAQLRQMHPARALPALRRARELAPAHEVPWYELRRALLLLRREAEAQEDFLRYESVGAPSARLICTALGVARRMPGGAMEARYLPQALTWPYRANDLEALSGLLCLLPYYDVSREAMHAQYRTDDELAQGLRGGTPPLYTAPEHDQGRLRIGLLSADFRTHIMGRIVEEILDRYDRKAFTFHLYSLMPRGGEDVLTARLREHVAGYAELSGLSEYAAANRIAQDRLHVLVDLMGHTTWSQPGILVFKPAPVIVTHLGFHGAIGLRQVDFKLSDAVADLPDAGRYQIEAPLTMAGSVIPIRRMTTVHRIAAHRTTRAPDAPLVFGAFVGPQKMSPRCLQAWARILERVPGSRLLFSPQQAAEQAIYRSRVASFGIDSERVDFLPMTLDEAHDRARYAAVDITLDAFPYTGGDSAACAAAEGVPLVTLCGTRHGERVAASVLTSVGVTETIAYDSEQYVDIALRLAHDRVWRERVAAELRAALPDHDTAMNAYTHHFEAALQEAWRLRGPAAVAAMNALSNDAAGGTMRGTISVAASATAVAASNTAPSAVPR